MNREKAKNMRRFRSYDRVNQDTIVRVIESRNIILLPTCYLGDVGGRN